MAHIPYGGDLIGSSPEFTEADLILHSRHRDSADAITRFSNELIHSLNNLLTVSIGYLERAQKLASSNHQRRNLDHARTSADDMVEALQRLQCFASTGRLMGESTCLVGALNDAVALLRTQAPDLKVTVVVDQPQRIDADVVETVRMFMNLFDNCRDAVDQNGEIHVRVREITTQHHPLGIKDGDYLVVTVSDNGPGIADDVLPLIFEPFMTTKPDHEGMGLSWVWGFVKKMQGSIRVRSQKDRGTSFEIFLPFGVNVPRRALASVTALRPVVHKRVLLVEDNEDVLDNIHNAMTLLNFQITTAKSSLEALQLISSQPFDLLIADLMIAGGHSGSDIADALIEANPCAKAVLITGRLNRKNIDVNSDYHLLVKPFSMEKLSKTIKSILS